MPAHDVPVALASQHSHGRALRDVLAFRDDVNSFRSDLGEPGRPKVGHGDAVQADEVGTREATRRSLPIAGRYAGERARRSVCSSASAGARHMRPQR